MKRGHASPQIVNRELGRTVYYMSGSICFISFICLFIFIPDTDVIITLLQYYVALLIPFSYEDKCLAQH